MKETHEKPDPPGDLSLPSSAAAERRNDSRMVAAQVGGNHFYVVSMWCGCANTFSDPLQDEVAVGRLHTQVVNEPTAKLFTSVWSSVIRSREPDALQWWSFTLWLYTRSCAVA